MEGNKISHKRGSNFQLEEKLPFEWKRTTQGGKEKNHPLTTCDIDRIQYMHGSMSQKFVGDG